MAQVPSIGLSTVRAQRFGNENLLGFYTPQAEEYFAFALATGDFNGDGADDLATGMPWDDGLADHPIADSGSVIVRYGIAAEGLATSLAGTVLRQTPAVNPAEEGDKFGYALAACDFNGDGFDDLAVGIPDEDHVDRVNAGGVQIHLGGSNGLPTSGWQFYAQSTPGMPGDAEDGDLFGSTLACGDFNADGFDDLVIGVPAEDLGSFDDDAGMVDIVPGTAFGLDPSTATFLSQNVDGMGGDGEIADQFGEGLAAGDFNGDGFDDLAIGSPGEDDEGAIHVVFGGRGGLAPAGSLFLMETGLGGSSEDDDGFGFRLTAADFDGDGFDDLAIAAPWENLGPGEVLDDTGQVCVLHGAAEGFDLTRNQFLSEDTILAGGTSESFDAFGFALAAGDFDKDGFADLAIGHPGEAIQGIDDGAATVLMGSATGLSNGRARIVAAGREGFPGDAAQNDRYFGWSLAGGDFDGDGHADLAIGAPREDVDGVIDVGTETVLYGALFADGVETGDPSFWSEARSSQTTKIAVTKDAQLGPFTSRLGLQVTLGNLIRTIPAIAYVRVGPDRGLANERQLAGSFFVDPLNVQMQGLGNGIFQMVAFKDDLGPSGKTRLAFDLVDTPTGYFLLANFHSDATNSLTFGGSGEIVKKGEPNGNNTRIDYEWRAGNPGHLTVWRSRYIGGVPDNNGKVLLIDIDLPNTGSAVINHVLAGVVQAQPLGTTGRLYLDELSFRR
jgi:hypothetical protein